MDTHPGSNYWDFGNPRVKLYLKTTRFTKEDNIVKISAQTNLFNLLNQQDVTFSIRTRPAWEALNPHYEKEKLYALVLLELIWKGFKSKKLGPVTVYCYQPKNIKLINKAKQTRSNLQLSQIPNPSRQT